MLDHTVCNSNDSSLNVQLTNYLYYKSHFNLIKLLASFAYAYAASASNVIINLCSGCVQPVRVFVL
jgi:hypothetical protein